jgi:hypothetical protein
MPPYTYARIRAATSDLHNYCERVRNIRRLGAPELPILAWHRELRHLDFVRGKRLF